MAREYDSNNRNRYGQRKIGGKPRTESSANVYGGVNAVNALQNRNVPSFGNPGGALNAQQWGGMARERGMGIGRGGEVFATRGPGGPRGFREGMQRRQRGGGGGRAETPQPRNFGNSLFGTALNAFLGGGDQPRQRGGRQSMASGPDQNRARLQEMVNSKRMLNPSPVFQSSPEAVAGGQPNAVLRSNYGTGSATMDGPRQESMIGGRPSREFFQDAADRQGVENKFAKPGGQMDPKKWREALAKKNLEKPGTRRI